MIFPSLPNAWASFKRLVLALFRREPVLVSQEVADARLNTCYACERYAPDDGQCLECTCYVEIKAQLDTEKCPLKKWKR